MPIDPKKKKDLTAKIDELENRLLKFNNYFKKDKISTDDYNKTKQYNPTGGTLPKGFGKDYTDTRYENTYPPRTKVVKSDTCGDPKCGHSKYRHKGLFIKGKCHSCLCPKFKTVRVERRSYY